MTSIVNQLSEELAMVNSYDALSTTVGAVTIFLLIGLLLGREMVSAAGASGSRRAIRVLDAAIVPLVGTAGVVMLARLAELV